MESLTPEQFFNKANWIEEDENKLSPMKSFYKGKTIFLTGGTGFLGQLYVEKLLRSDVKHIYLLGRAKKGQSAEDRLKNTFTGAHFMKLYNHDPDYLKRISIIEGEMSELNVGISDSDQKDLIENVEIVIHAAADVRFDEKLVTLLMVNLRGTREMLELAGRMKKLQAFSFISTAYSHCIRKFVEEKYYGSPVDPDIMIKIGELYTENPNDDLRVLSQRIIRPWPNSYTYTKSLTEELVRRYGKKFPICIIRPTIVISTFEDPVPGWSNNIYGLNGALIATGLGVLRLVPLKNEAVGDVVCADFVINSTLAALWVTYEDSIKNATSDKLLGKDPEIYHVCTSTDRPLKWGTMSKSMSSIFEQYPSSRTIWKQCTNSVTHPFWIKYLTIFYHVIPAILTDTVLKLRGKSLRVLPIYRKVQRFMIALSYFMMLEVRFDNTNMKRVLHRMSTEDQEFFPSDVRRYEWSNFIYSYLCGLKVYISLESLDDLYYARKRYRRLVVLHFFVLLAYYGMHIAAFTFLADKLGIFHYVKSTVYGTYGFLTDSIIPSEVLV